LQKELDSVKKAKLYVVAVSYDSVKTLAGFGKQNKIRFPLLSDADSKVIEAYGILNEDVRPGSREDGVPHPGTFLIGQDGVIRAKLFYTIFKRHTPQELIETASQLRKKRGG